MGRLFINNKLFFYTVNSAYCDYLRQYDPLVPYTMDKKSKRPFVGIVLNVNGTDYYIPLSSPKKKHLTMHNGIDFLKINEGKWGAININNMIPVPKSVCNKINLKINNSDNEAEKKSKSLLQDQMTWCTKNTDKIKKKAISLYKIITKSDAPENLKSRCCDFHTDEKYCKLYK